MTQLCIKKAYSGLSTFSHPSRAKLQYVHVAMSSDSGVGVYFQPASTIYTSSAVLNFSVQHKSYLLDLAFPPFLALMWPFIGERRLPRLDHPVTRRIFLTELPILSLNHRDNSPPAVRRVFHMFHQRVITLFPPIKRFAAEEASDIIWVDLVWVVEESSFRELAYVSRSSKCGQCSIPLLGRATCEAISWTWAPLYLHLMPSSWIVVARSGRKPGGCRK